MFSPNRQVPEFSSTIFLVLVGAIIFAVAFLLTQTIRRRLKPKKRKVVVLGEDFA
jgi:uncharacterized PurR-regulated membrane protein YhhQ (DUF165 family)